MVNGKELAIKEFEVSRNQKQILTRVAMMDLLGQLQPPAMRMDLTATLYGEAASLHG